MHYSFDDFLLDLDRGELRHGDDVVSIEPMAYAVLGYLAQNSDRLVSKDELIEKVWDGRFISDSAVSTVIKSLRRVLGDDGKQQRYIKTVHGRGFRFGAELQVSVPARAASVSVVIPEAADIDAVASPVDRKPMLAVLPFSQIGVSEAYAAIADAIPGELISTLSRLRWLSVTARGSSFRFRPPAQNIETIREALGVTYVLSGEVELLGPALGISVELVDAETSQVVWGDRLSGKIDDVHNLREEIVALVVSALEMHVPQHEAELAQLRSPSDLDAWSNYHLGIRLAYRFNRTDNEKAAEYFRRATELDPHFSRAYAARSFVNFQRAFLRYTPDRAKAIDDARRYAERSVELDAMDPFASFNCGRAHWLRGDPLAGQSWLERSVSLSPSFAQGFYAHAWADTMAGDGLRTLGNLDRSVTLSPLDPLRYAMLSLKGISLFSQGNLEQGAHWSEEGARTPGAHFLISAIAASINEIAGNQDKAVYWARETKARRADASIRDFFNAFPFKDEKVANDLRGALTRLGFPDQ